jgi:hypothetical protein
MSDPVTRLNAALEGRYRIERPLGEGGMATVYLARDLRHNRNVALKVLKPELAAALGADRFLAEIETTANLQHPHILPLFDSGAADALLFYTMPYVDGETLRRRLEGTTGCRSTRRLRVRPVGRSPRPAFGTKPSGFSSGPGPRPLTRCSDPRHSSSSVPSWATRRAPSES